MVAFRVAQVFAFLSCSAAAGSSQRSLLTRLCDGDYENLKPGDLCTTTWSKMTKGSHQMRPTQPSVGYAWVVYKMRDHFYSHETAAKYLGKKTLPVVMYDDDFYLTDHHHLSTALQLTGNDDLFDIEMTVEIVADFRGMGSSDFWPTMEDNRYAFLYSIDDTRYDSQLVKIPPSAMPRDFVLTSFTDNIYRAFASFSTHIDDAPSSPGSPDERCYVKTCTWYLDFEWAHIFVTAIYKDESLWSDNESFKALVESLPLRPTADMVDIDAWFTVAKSLLPLCHSDSINDYTLPDGFPSGTLDGWGTVPMPDDPDCAARTTLV